MQKHVNLVDLVKSFPTNILLQNLASIQKRTSPAKSDNLTEKSKKGSISNLSTKVERRRLLPQRVRRLAPRQLLHDQGGGRGHAGGRILHGSYFLRLRDCLAGPLDWLSGRPARRRLVFDDEQSLFTICE